MTSLGVEWGAKYTLTGPDGTVVVFNDSTDPNFVGVLSPESSGLDSPDVREDATDATEEDGGHHGDFFEGRRPVVLQGTIIASSVSQRNERVGKLKRATRALRGDATLEWQPTGGPKVELKLRRQQALRITKGFVKEFQAAMVAADIFPKSKTVNSKNPFKTLVTGNAAEHIGVAVDATFLYYSNGKTIGRIKLDGTGNEPNFITTGVVTTTHGITVDANFIYWAGEGNVGRAKINGTEVLATFITAPAAVIDVAVNSEFIYWTDTNEFTIGRAKLNGTEPNNSFITGASQARGIAIDSGFIYWTINSNKIGRATLAGGSKNLEFITLPNSGERSWEIAVDSEFIYWAQQVSSGAIGRAKINGTSVESEWINLPTEAWGLTKNSTTFFFSDVSGNYVAKIEPEFTLKNEGDVGAFPIMKVLGPGSAFALENAITKETIVLEGITLGEGEYFAVDFKNHTIKKNGTTYAYNALNFTLSKWWKLEPGENKIIITGGTAEVFWQDTFI